MDRIEMKYQELDKFANITPLTQSNAKDESRFSLWMKQTWPVISEIDYFTYLVDKNEIKNKNVLFYYRHRLYNIFIQIEAGIMLLKGKKLPSHQIQIL